MARAAMLGQSPLRQRQASYERNSESARHIGSRSSLEIKIFEKRAGVFHSAAEAGADRDGGRAEPRPVA